jgi:hypothetical protein
MALIAQTYNIRLVKRELFVNSVEGNKAHIESRTSNRSKDKNKTT